MLDSSTSPAKQTNESKLIAAESAPDVGMFLHLVGVLYRATPEFEGKWNFLKWYYQRCLKGRRTDVIRLNRDTTMHCNFSSGYGVWTLGEKYERREADYFRSLMKPGATFFDVGSNVGYYSLLAAPMVGAEGRVHSFEPVSSMYAMLSSNIKRNNLQNAVTNRAIVSDSPGQKTINLAPDDNCGSSSVGFVQRDDPLSETVQCITLDEYIRDHAITRVDVVKIDVEGEELAVLKGARTMLREKRPVLFIEIKDRLLQRSGSSSNELYSFLSEFGYSGFKIKAGGSLEPIAKPCDVDLAVFQPVKK